MVTRHQTWREAVQSSIEIFGSTVGILTGRNMTLKHGATIVVCS